MAEEVGVAELKRRFSEYLNRVALRHERIVIRRRGRTVAAMVPLDEVAGHEEQAGQRRGLLAAVGAWADYPDHDDFLRELERARSRSRDRKTDPLA